MKRMIVLTTVVLAGCNSSGGTSTEPPPGGTPPPGAPAPAPSAGAVEMRSSQDAYGYDTHAFVPNSVRISRQGTVTWANPTGLAHNVTFAAATGAPANVPDFTSGSQARSFPTAGNFSYRCSLHDGMAGTVEVVN